MLLLGTTLVYTSLEREGHRLEEVALLSELKENPAWLFPILPDLGGETHGLMRWQKRLQKGVLSSLPVCGKGQK